jgi:hypothetical protein
MHAAPSSGMVESVCDAQTCQKKAVSILTAAVNTNLENDAMKWGNSCSVFLILCRQYCYLPAFRFQEGE